MLRAIQRRNQKAAGIVETATKTSSKPTSKSSKKSKKANTKSQGWDTVEGETLPHSFPKQHHQMSDSKRDWVHIPTWLDDNEEDPALQVSHFPNSI